MRFPKGIIVVLVSCISILTPTLHSFEYKIFGNADFVGTSKSTATEPGGFINGTVDFFFSHSITPRIEVLSEITVHPHKTGLAGIDMERLQAGYLFHDAFRLWIGRYHNILGYWNTAYHHGLILHTSIDRPDFIKWEHDGGFLPVHLNGLWAEGRVPAGPVKLQYGVMVGNGPRIISSGMQANNIGDDNTNKAVAFNLTVRPRALPFTGAGVSGNFSRITEWQTATTARSDTLQNILGGHLFHTQGPLEMIAEYYNVRDKGVGISSSSGTHTSHAFFVQVGYGFREKYIPYLRFERVEADAQSTYVTALNRNPVPQPPVPGVTPSSQDYFKWILGFRYNFNVHSALKLEGRYANVPGSAKSFEHIFREIAFQWAFSF